MFTSMAKRRYRQGKRAEQTGETRDRIVEATMQLHEELGVARTTISAIAERAGVQRLTVYRHFADESELLQACTSRWLELNPQPDPAGWQALEDPLKRTLKALTEIFDYYRRTRAMWASSYRDVDEVPELARRMAAIDAHYDAMAAQLSKDLGSSLASRRRLEEIIRHALAFSTWRSFADRGHSDRHIVELMRPWIEAATG